MRFVIGADHGGYELKEQLIRYLKDMEHEILDVGTDSSDSVDYPDICKKACDVFISHGSFDAIILVCGTGIGMCMVANKHYNIRAALCERPSDAKLAREHNNANVLCLAGRRLTIDDAWPIVETFLHTPFSLEERHEKRIGMFPQ